MARGNDLREEKIGSLSEVVMFLGVPVSMNWLSGSHRRPLVLEGDVAPQSRRRPENEYDEMSFGVRCEGKRKMDVGVLYTFEGCAWL